MSGNRTVTELEDENMRAERDACLQAILSSQHPKKLVVAGPGTGKTHAFKELLKTADGQCLALTFLLVLVHDLGNELEGIADVYSFHGFARHLLHQRQIEGVSRDVHYFPLVSTLYVEDLLLREGIATSEHALGGLFRGLADDDLWLQRALESGSYYNAVGHDDSVYRVLKYLELHGEVPRFGQVVVDEYQDFCPLEVALIDLLATANPILIAGDDDQALYAFRDATPEALRTRAADADWQTFELPYCSRCTAVLVQATHTVVAQAQAIGLLDGRLDKRYECYLPDKRAESEQYPRIIHARCSVETGRAPYLCRYIEERIRAIDPADIQQSHEKGFPTVLIIAPNPFYARIERHLRAVFGNVSSRDAAPGEIDVLDGYRLLLADERSRLGWRVLLHCLYPTGWQALVRQALENGQELFDMVSDEFRESQLRIVDLLRRLMDEGPLTAEERAGLADALGVSSEELVDRVTASGPDKPEVDPDEPTILISSLMGSKGLQASHVFVAGVNEHHFPRDNGHPTNEEVCQLLVALTRARKSCTIVSCGRLGAVRLAPSCFTRWLAPHLDVVNVNQQYFTGGA